MTDTPPPRKPLLVEMESDAPDPGAAPPVPDLPPEGAAMQALGRAATARRSTLGRLAGWAFGALAGFVLALASLRATVEETVQRGGESVDCVDRKSVV